MDICQTALCRPAEVKRVDVPGLLSLSFVTPELPYKFNCGEFVK